MIGGFGWRPVTVVAQAQAGEQPRGECPGILHKSSKGTRVNAVRTVGRIPSEGGRLIVQKGRDIRKSDQSGCEAEVVAVEPAELTTEFYALFAIRPPKRIGIATRVNPSALRQII